MGAIFFRTRNNLANTLSRLGKKKDKINKWEQKTAHSGLTPKVLIVDDDPEAAQLLQIVMVNFGFDITFAFDGKEALEELSKKSFDIVFLDVMMPGMSGPQVLSQIEELQRQNLKACKKWGRVPVITYSSFNREKIDVPEERGFYVVDHWQKPITFPELTTRMSDAISQLGISIPTKPAVSLTNGGEL